MYELNKRDKAAIRAAELLGPHSAAALRELLIKEGNARLKMDRRMEMLMSGSQAAEDIILAEDAMDAMEMDAIEEDKKSNWKWEGIENSEKCCGCQELFPIDDSDSTVDDGEQCYYCGGIVCSKCIDFDAAHAIGKYDLESETVCKTCCEHEVNSRSKREQKAEKDLAKAKKIWALIGDRVKEEIAAALKDK